MNILFKINFTEIITDTEAIQLFQTSKYNYNKNYPKYKLKQAYSVQVLLPFLSSESTSKTFKPILIWCNNITTITELNLLLLAVESLSLTTITHLAFGDKFNDPIDVKYSTLNKLTHLTFGDYFNQSVDHLPS